MKNKCLIFLPLLATVLVGCSSNNESNKNNKVDVVDVYSDKTSFKDGDLEFNFTYLYDRKITDNYDLSITLEVVNKNANPYDFKFDSPTIKRETNGAEYTVGGYFISQYSLECDIKKSISFSSTIPTSIKDENYLFNLKYGSKEVIYHLYEMPDELRNKIDVKFVVDANEAETIKIPEERPLVNYAWLSPDYVYGCKEWYLDSKYENKVPATYVVTEPLTVYGQKQSVLKYNMPSGTDSSFVSGYNFIPESGEIVIPRAYEGKPVYSILAGAFKGPSTGLKAVFIPKTVRISATANFSTCYDLEYVYFEGTEQEWSTMNEATYPSNTKIVFNNYK